MSGVPLTFEKVKEYKKPKVIYISKDENLYDNHKITY